MVNYSNNTFGQQKKYDKVIVSLMHTFVQEYSIINDDRTYTTRLSISSLYKKRFSQVDRPLESYGINEHRETSKNTRRDDDHIFLVKTEFIWFKFRSLRDTRLLLCVNNNHFLVFVLQSICHKSHHQNCTARLLARYQS